MNENLAPVENRILLRRNPSMDVVDDELYDDIAFIEAATGTPCTDDYELRRQAEATALAALAEEMVAIGATGLVVYDFLDNGKFDSIPAYLRKRMTFHSALEWFTNHNIVGPIETEIWERAAEWRCPDGLIRVPEREQFCINYLHLAMNEVLLAVRQRLAITFDVRAAARAVEIVRQFVKSDDARRVCVAMSAYFNAYQYTAVDTIVVRPDASAQFIASFGEFLDDGAYRQLAHTCHLVGERAHMRSAVAKIARAVRHVCKAPLARGLVNIGTRILGAAVGMPLPGADTLIDVVGDSYIPPAVDYGAALQRANARWREELPRLASAHGLIPKARSDA